MMKVMSVFGTRPEAIKMCPLVLELQKDPDFESIVCLTGQHREMLRQVIDIFGVKADYNLDIMRPGQTLSTITSAILDGMGEVLQKEQPDLVLVHGDTTTCFAAALAAFYHKIPVGHVEAGLRTYDKYSPFPEEMNRCLTGKIASLHFPPTENSLKNLKKEGITEQVYLTGNTVLDAFSYTVKANYVYQEKELAAVDFTGKRCILLTAHRRENLGEPLEQICGAVKELAGEFPDIEVIYPVHMNPAVRKTAEKVLGSVERVHLIPPLNVQDMHNLMAKSFLVLTDSGGLQEEAPSFGVPVLVLRTETERPEAVSAGTARIVGTKKADILENARLLLRNEEVYRKMSGASNPYGDGKASRRIVSAIKEWHQERK